MRDLHENRWRWGITRKSGRFNRSSRMDIANRYHIEVTTIEHVTSRVSLVNGKRSQLCVCSNVYKRVCGPVNAGRPTRTNRSELERLVNSFIGSKCGTAMGTWSRILKQVKSDSALERDFSANRNSIGHRTIRGTCSLWYFFSFFFLCIHFARMIYNC